MYGLLKDKKQDTYFTFFNLLSLKCAERNFTLSPKVIVADFEVAIHNSLKQMWENIRVEGCGFHLTQAWFRKIQELDLVKAFKDKKSEDGTWLKHLFGLLS